MCFKIGTVFRQNALKPNPRAALATDTTAQK